jgi:sugar phosphate permease
MTTSSLGAPSRQESTADVQRLLLYRWLVFAVLGLDGALLSFHYVWGATLSGPQAVTWGVDVGRLGLLAALGFLPYALMQIPGGYITDRFGGRRALSVALAVTAAGTALLAGAPTFGVAVVGRIVIGVGSAVILLPSLVVLARWFRTREYATIQGGYLLLAALGSLVATVPLAVAAERWSWRAPMLADAAITLLGAGLSWWVIRNDPGELGLPPIAAIDPDAEAIAPGDDRLSLRAGFRLWRTVPTLWVTSLILFASWGALQAFQGLWAGPVLRQVRGFSTTEVGQSLFMFTLGVGLGPVLFGWLSDRVVRARRPFVIAGLIGQTLLWLLVVATIAWLPTLLLDLAFFGIAGLSGGVLVAQVMVKESSPPGTFGTIFGIINGAPFYGTAALQLLGSGILALIGPEHFTDEPIYGAQAYSAALFPVVVLMVIATGFSFRLQETLAQRRAGMT